MWKRIVAWIAGIGLAVGIIGSCNVMLYRDKERTKAANTIQHAPVLFMEKTEHGYYYSIYLDGFGSEDWRKEKLRLTIDKTIPKGAPSALFEYNTRYHRISDRKEVILSFHDREDLTNFMGGIDMAVSVQSGGDSNVVVSKSTSNADSCFISALGGGTDETYIL